MSTQRSVIFDACSRSVGFIRWIGFLPTTPSTSPLAAEESDALADEHLRIPAADRDEVDEAVVVDVLDDQRRSRRCGRRA